MTRDILMLSWEYPPNIIGGLARHVACLSRALVKAGHRVIVLTQADSTSPAFAVDEGVEVHRLPATGPPPRDFVDRVKQLNFQMIERAVQLFASGRRFDIVHAHDWLAAYAGKTMKHAFAKPLVATVHATEHGRNNGLHNELQRYIGSCEWWLTYEAWRVICCSRFMEEEVQRVFHTPGDKIRIVPNGVDSPRPSKASPDDAAFRARFAGPDESIVFFLGRLVHEKGVHVLLDAVPRILQRRPDTRFVIAGEGPLRAELEAQARSLGIAAHVTFFGYADDVARDRFLRMARVAVFPSLYEPFGIVALEAMAAGTPVVVGRTGGFAEIVTNRRNGLHAEPGDPHALAARVLELLDDDGLATALRRAALRTVRERYSWSTIARRTAGVYEEVLQEYEQSRWDVSDTGHTSKEVAAWHALVRHEGRRGMVNDGFGRYMVTASGANADGARMPEANTSSDRLFIGAAHGAERAGFGVASFRGFD